MSKKKVETIWSKIKCAAIAGVKDAEDLLRVSNKVAQWEVRGYVPPGEHYNIVQRGIENRIEGLTHEVLHKQWQRARMVR